MITLKAVCGHCRRMARFEFVYMQPAPYFYGKYLDIEAYAGMANCSLCERPSLFEFVRTCFGICNYAEACRNNIHLSINDDEHCSIEAQYPPARMKTHESWPDNIGEILEAIQRQLQDGTPPSLAISACRTVLDIAIKQLGAKGRDLFQKIDDLHNKGIITKPLADWAHRLRLVGNDAVHDATGNSQEAKALFDFVVMFLNVCFTLPADIAQHNTVAASQP